MRTAGPQRFLIATGVTNGLLTSGPRIVRSVSTMVDLFTGAFGYQRHDALGLDPGVQDFRRRLRAFCMERDPQDLLVVYHTGHADLRQTRHRLWMGDTKDEVADTLVTSELAELMMDQTPLRQALIILDTCHAGGGGAETLLAGMRAMGRQDKTLVVVTAAHPIEQIQAGEFARLFAAAVDQPASAGHEPPYLSLDAIVGCINANASRQPSQTVAASVLFRRGELEPFLPNPRYAPELHGLDLATQLRVSQRQLRLDDLRQHFLPRARGVEQPHEQAWRFLGRHAVLADLAEWLRAPEPDGVRVVTGDPGSGKSAVIGRLAVLSDPDWRNTVPLEGVPPETVPVGGALDACIHARGLTSAQVLEGLCAAAGIASKGVEELVLALRARRLVVAIDALDEAVDPDKLADEILRPLVDSAGRCGLRLLLGTRRHLVGRLGAQTVVLDLDEERYADPGNLRLYAERVLVEVEPLSAYRGADGDLVRDVAAAVADAAGRSFLVALIVSRSLASLPYIPDPRDRSWVEALPGTAAEAMHNDLESRLGDQAQRARDLLTPLAYSHGAGFPWEDLWPALASHLSGRVYTDEDLIWLRREAGSYVVEALESGRSVYRLYHTALAEYLRQGTDERAVHRNFAGFLLDRVPGRWGMDRDWSRAHPYIRSHLAIHATEAHDGTLDALVTDPGYLIYATPAPLMTAFPHVATPGGRLAATAYQRVLHQLRVKPETERLSYLELAAHRVGATTLAARIAALPADRLWSARWSQWPNEVPHRILSGHQGPVTDVRCVAGPSGRPHALTLGLDAKLRRWDMVTAEELTVHDLCDRAGQLALAARFDARGQLAAVLTTRGQVSIWDVGSGTRHLTFPVGRMPRRSLIRVKGDANLGFLALPSGPAVVTWGKSLVSTLRDAGSGDIIARLPARVSKGNLDTAELEDGRTVLKFVSDQWQTEFWNRETGKILPSEWNQRFWSRLRYLALPDGTPVLAASSRLFRFAAQVPITIWELTSDRRIWTGLASLGGEIDFDGGRRVIISQRIVSTQERHAPAYLWPEKLPDQPDLHQVTVVTLDGIELIPIGETRLESVNSSHRATLQFMTAKGPVPLNGHTGPITAHAALDVADGRTLVVTSSEDGTARVWDVAESAQPSATDPAPVVQAHGVRLARRSHGWDVVALMGESDRFNVWDMKDGRLGDVIQAEETVSAYTTTAEGDLLTFGSSHYGSLYDLEHHEIAQFGADAENWPLGAATATLTSGRRVAATGGHGTRAVIWDLVTGDILKIVKGHGSIVRAVATDRLPDGTPIAIFGGDDFRISVWDLTRMRRRRRFSLAGWLRGWTMLRAAWSSNGADVADGVDGVDAVGHAVHHGESLIVVRRGSGKPLLVFGSRGRGYRRRGIVPGSIDAFALLRRGGACWIVVATSEMRIEVWDPYAETPLFRIDIDAKIVDLAVAEPGHLILATNKGIAVFSLSLPYN